MKIDSEDYHAWFDRGKLMTTLQRYGDALLCFERALHCKPSFYEAWCEKGVVLEHLHRYEEADRCFNQALGVFTECLEENLDDLLAVNPQSDSSNLLYNRACSQALQGNFEAAIASLQEAIALNPVECRQLAQNDPDFDRLKQVKQFRVLVANKKVSEMIQTPD